jgi:hypothetical protein
MWIRNPEKILIMGISHTFSAVFLMRYPYSGIERQVTTMVWLINNQGIMPTSSHGANGRPVVVLPVLKPTEKTNQMTNTNMAGWIKAHGKPMYDERYLPEKSLITSVLMVVRWLKIYEKPVERIDVFLIESAFKIKNRNYSCLTI